MISTGIVKRLYLFLLGKEYIMKIQLTLLLFVVFAGLVLLGCKKDEETCESIIENTGIIVESVDFSCDTPYRDGSFIINSQNELDSIIDLNSGCNRPSIDFAQYTVLGRYAYASCVGSYYREVVSDTANQQYNYSISVISCGDCDCLCENMNWVLVPKLPEGYAVEFTVSNSK
jgi:hypothetical protein